ncbi:hypothetical protein PbJCM13498_01800 [Prolixibacter bellariivorans]|uniref:Pectate lyase n=1 Tax=Prolixibacter bellariivorans TaxID=314319 RepID=A0A5M4AV61_9BACT|nr:hypothetical protein [Prolixibacter bellariivorans]GET31317.1 hypothetical protein PbJCM13498_01800 [Prolixibacter bellariivorans]
MNSNKISLIYPRAGNGILKQGVTTLIFILFIGVFSGQASNPLKGTPEAQTLLKEFPFLGKLLTTENPWEMQPEALAGKVFDRMPKIAQGDEAYPLLFSDRREENGWPGEKIFGQYAYESEYYTFDREYPVMKLHVGRPLLFGVQHGRVEALAMEKKLTPTFPFLDPKVIPPFLQKLDSIVYLLAPYGARRLPSDFYLASRYLLPNDVLMTVTNLTGSTNGTPYVEIELRPWGPVEKFADSQTLAFPGAEGAGRYSRGGRGGKVFVVTSLDDYLPNGRPGRPEGTYGQASEYATTLGKGKWIPYVDALGNKHPGEGRPLLPGFPALPPEKLIHGTLREAVEAKGPRYIVFAVSGTIRLKAPLDIKNPYITIAGQTAPGDGIQIRNFGIRVNTHDVILRYLRIRVGDIKGPGNLKRLLGEQTHALDLNGMNIIADHCDIAYACDQVFNTYGQHRREATTLQWSYIYGAPTASTHEKGNHSMISVGVGWGWVSSHHNLLAHGRVRNPRIDMLTYDFRNNVIYNFVGTGYGSSNDYLRLNYVGNTLKKGPDSKGNPKYAWSENTKYAQWYGRDNKLPADFKSVFGKSDVAVISAPIPSIPVVTQPAEEAYRLVLEKGGATKPVRDTITSYVAQTVKNGTGFIPGTPADWPEGGFATYPKVKAPVDTNKNGIPDKWEISHGLDLKKTKATGHDLDPKYDNIEVYMNSI